MAGYLLIIKIFLFRQGWITLFRYGSKLHPGSADFVELSLGGVVGDPLQGGKFRTPTLRIIVETAPYMRNGIFNTLEEMVGFIFQQMCQK